MILCGTRSDTSTLQDWDRTNKMKTPLKMMLACTLLGAGFLTGTSRSHAALLAYDGFNYSAGNVNGQNGGSGWSSSWVASASPALASVVTGTTLSYTGGSVSISGSGSALSITGGGDGVLNRAFVGTGTGSEIYFSFLFRAVSGSGNEFSHFYLSNDADRLNSGGVGDFFTAANDSRFGARVNDETTDTTAATSTSYATGTDYLLVGRLSTDGTSGSTSDILDQVELWVNPTSLTMGTAHATANASTGLTIADLGFFSSRMVNFADPDPILIDELRIGTDLDSVVPVPEPSATVIQILSGVVLIAWYRKSAVQPS